METRTIIVISLLLSLASCAGNAQESEILNEEIFNNCDTQAKGEYSILEHELFTLEYPSSWNEDNKIKRGIDISSNNFSDSLERGFMLSVVPYQEFYLKKNPNVDYFRFKKGSYKDYEGVYLTRNDLGAKETENTVYWRSELKLVSKDESLMYIVVLGRRYSKNEEPSWCDFGRIIETLRIKE